MKPIFTRVMAVWLAVAAGLAVIGGAVLGISLLQQSKSALRVQDFAKEWQGEGEIRESMVSAFFDTDASVTLNDINSFREAVDRKLVEASISTDNQNARLYIDAYAAKGTISIRTDRATVSAEAFGVGGDFFRFHQLPLMSGWYQNDDEVGMETVVLDEVAAWQLFGGPDVAGLTVTVNDVPYTVAGVVKPEEGDGYDEAYGTGPHVYLNYTAYSRITGDADSGGAPIICYEMAMPSPVTNFAYNIIKDSFGRSAPQAAYIENTGRYSASKLYTRLGEFFGRSVRADRVVYPYWENTASVTADICAVLLLVQTIFFGAAGIISVVLVIIMIVRSVPYLKRLKDRTADRLESISYSGFGKKKDKDDIDI